MIRVQAWKSVCSPKFYGPLTIWPWLKISPQSSLNVIYYLIISAWQWLMSFPYMPCIPMQIKPIKACQGKGWGAPLLIEWPRCSKALSPWKSGHVICFPPQDSVVRVNLSRLSHNTTDTACWCLRQKSTYSFNAILLYWWIFSHSQVLRYLSCY